MKVDMSPLLFRKIAMKRPSQQNLQEDEYIIPYHYLLYPDKLISFPQKLIVTCDYVCKLEYLFEAYGFEGGGKLLDAGCGTGRVVHELDRQGLSGIDYHGVDYSERAVGLAKALNPQQRFSVADLTQETNLPADTYDIIISIETLEHLPPEKLSAAVDELHRVLKSQGRAIITVPHKNRPLSPKHYQHFTSDILTELLNHTFSIVKMEGFHHAGLIRNIPLRIFSGLYYFLYPLKKLKCACIPDFINRCAYAYFHRCLQTCGKDSGLTLIVCVEKC
jgi:SAM-dependent methyltransferase